MKHFTKDNIATFLQTLLVIFLLGYSAVNGNSKAKQQTVSSKATLQQWAILPQQPGIPFAKPINQTGIQANNYMQKIIYRHHVYVHTNCCTNYAASY